MHFTARPGLYSLALLIVLVGSLSAAEAETPLAKWENGPAAGDDHFTIGVWLQDPANAQRYRDLGVNLYIGLWQGPTRAQLEALREAEMPVIARQNDLARTMLEEEDELLQVIVGWKHQDEPDNAQRQDDGWGPPVPPEQISRIRDKWHEHDGTRPVYLNLGQGVAWDGWIGRGERTGKPEDYSEYQKGADILSFDIYPAASTRATRGEHWRVGYGVKRLRAWTDDDKPVWNILEASRISGAGKVTPQEMRAQVWMSIIYGSTGITWFVHEFEDGRYVTDRAIFDDDELRLVMRQLNARLQELAPVIHGPTVEDGHTVELTEGEGDDRIKRDYGIAPVATMQKRHEGAVYLFAVRMRDATAEARFTIDGLEGGDEVAIIGEDRTLRSRDGTFSDKFEAWDSRIYRIESE